MALNALNQLSVELFSFQTNAPVFLTNISEAVVRKYNHCLWPKVTAVVASAHGKEESEQKYYRAAYLRICRTIQCIVKIQNKYNNGQNRTKQAFRGTMRALRMLTVEATDFCDNDY